MTDQEIKAEAEKIIQEFKPFVESEPFYSNKGGTIRKSIEYNAIQCAIIHANRTLSVISVFPNDSTKRIVENLWQSILTELERK